jgi:hypothetical protein
MTWLSPQACRQNRKQRELLNKSLQKFFDIDGESVKQLAGLCESCVDLGHRVNLPPTQRRVVGRLQSVERLTQSVEIVARRWGGVPVSL